MTLTFSMNGSHPPTLKTKTIKVGGQTFTLCETTLRTDHRRGEMLRRLSEQGPVSGDSTVEQLAPWSYANLTACVVEGTPPTLEEYPDLPLREVSAWQAAARQLNPDWFPHEADTDPKANA